LVTPYLVVKGAAEAIEFYKKVFGAVEQSRMNDGARVGHAELRIGKSAIMLADEYPEHQIVGPRSLGGSPVRLQVETRDVDAVAKRASAAGAKILQPPRTSRTASATRRSRIRSDTSGSFRRRSESPASRRSRRGRGRSRRI
jgi:uncharacterized glyoxalase superfamily protein PhnB